MNWVEKRWGGVIPSPFASKHAENRWGGVGPSPFASGRTNRGNRIRLSFGALTPLLWGVAVIGTLVSIIFPWFFGSPTVTAPLLMSTLVAAVTMSVFLVILKLS